MNNSYRYHPIEIHGTKRQKTKTGVTEDDNLNGQNVKKMN